jgi:hypothetical protein
MSNLPFCDKTSETTVLANMINECNDRLTFYKGRVKGEKELLDSLQTRYTALMKRDQLDWLDQLNEKGEQI